MDDHQLASHLAAHAGRALLDLRSRADAEGLHHWALRDRGDRLGHDLLVELLAEHRPDDAVLSEEGTDDRTRLDSPRTWIIDPLDGTHDYPFPDSVEWAVHVGLVEGTQAVAGAVACPSMGRLFGTQLSPYPQPTERDDLVVVSSRSSTWAAAEVADTLGAKLATCGSAGVKASLVIGGEADVYVHGSGLYEWDACAPAVVAEAAGLVVAQLDGSPLEYNKPHPVVRGLVIARPELADAVFGTLQA